jgi:hypothetical protein
MPSPLKKCWKPGMVDDDEEINCVIVIDDSNLKDNFFINYLFSKIHEYTHNESAVNPLQCYFFWKSIRSFIEFRHQQIMNNKRENLRVRLLSSNIYEFACYQEMMFGKIDL